MTLNGSFAALVLAASLAGSAVAQKGIVVDDEAIFLAVHDALDRAVPLAWARISVRSREGFVTLTGFAATMEDIATAGRLAAGVRGVTGVTNEIRVADRAWRS